MITIAARLSLLVGGLGADTLIGGRRGRTLIAAADRADGDRVIRCEKGNLVLADAGDGVRGRCGVARRIRRR